MSNFSSGTFNTIGKRSGSVGGHFPIWSRVHEVYQGGGTIALTDAEGDAIYNPGDVIGAGTMVIFNGPGKAVTIVKSTDTSNLTKVNGLIFEDVCIPEGVELATCAVVRAGRIYADRVSTGIPASVESNLPMIEFVRE